MRATSNNSSLFGAVVITVHVESKDVEQLVNAVDKMPWQASFSHFEAYLSPSRRPSLGAEMRSANVCIAVIDFDRDPDQAAETAQYLTQILGTRIILVGLAKSSSPELLLTAMRSGCNEFLYKPLDSGAIGQMLGRFALAWSSSPQRNASEGTVLSFIGAKGGVGTTTLAIHLAMYLVQCHQKRTLLIDHHSELGHVCVYLGVDGSRYNFHELVRNVHRLDSELLQGFVANHSSGLKILSSPDVCGGSKYMDPSSVAKTLEFLRSEYDFVIADCSATFDEVDQVFLHASSNIYLVATQEFAAIRDLSRRIDKLLQLEDKSEKLQIVLNRFTSSYAINAEQIEKAIKLPIARSIPDSYDELLRSANMGETIPPSSKLEFAGQMVKWTEALTGTQHRPKPAQKDKKFFPIWKRALMHTD